jgi:predicted KAP-like P-loop ATPase
MSTEKTIKCNIHPPKKGKLGFDKYADGIANFLTRLDVESTGLTIGIFGSWGTGKTTLLQMIKQKLKHKQENTQEKDLNLLLISFSAWRYNDQTEVWMFLII